jgi:hypothetical protein
VKLCLGLICVDNLVEGNPFLTLGEKEARCFVSFLGLQDTEPIV